MRNFKLHITIILSVIFLGTASPGAQASFPNFFRRNEVKEVSVREFLKASPSDNVKYRIKGIVRGPVSQEWGDFFLADATGWVYVYGATRNGLEKGQKNDRSFSSLGVREGDEIVLEGYRITWKGTPELTRARYVSHRSRSGKTPSTTAPSRKQEIPSYVKGGQEKNVSSSRTGNMQERRGPSRGKPSYLELPSTGKDEQILVHRMNVDGRNMRNWSYVWDDENMVASWIAYPMNSAIIGDNIKRTDNWSYDPLLPSSRQPLLAKGYRDGNSGWRSRGHQIASADRLYDFSQNSTTFYYTNMTPQESSFNGGLWNSLEMKVRGIAKRCDTLYVITGCVTKGSKGYCLDNSGRKVTIPVAYYKAVLAYSRKPGFGHSGYMGCAWYYEHREYKSGKVNRDDAISIDSLEKILGMDLFVNLPDVVGKRTADAIEAENPAKVSWW